MEPQEQVMALEVPNRVEWLEGQDLGGGDPQGPDLQMEQLKGVDARDAPLMQKAASS